MFSTLGSWTLRFLLGFSAWDLTQSATWVGIVAAAMLAPALLLAPLFGVLSDRINPRNGLLVTNSTVAVLAALGSITLLADAFNLPALILLALALGITVSAHTPIRLALIPELVPRRALPSAVGYAAITFNVSRILGPALGAWLLHASSPAFAYGCSAALIAVALPFLVGIQGRAITAHERTPPSVLAQLREGLAYARSHTLIRLVFALTLVNALLGRTVIELLPAVSGKLLGGDAATLATLTASAGLGSIMGGVIVSRQGGEQNKLVRLMTLCLAWSAMVVAVLGLSQTVTWIAVAVGAVSLAATVTGATSQAVAQLAVEDRFRGRVLSLWTMLAMGAPAGGALLMGALADRFPFQYVLVAFAACALLALAVLRVRTAALAAP